MLHQIERQGGVGVDQRQVVEVIDDVLAPSTRTSVGAVRWCWFRGSVARWRRPAVDQVFQAPATLPTLGYLPDEAELLDRFFPASSVEFGQHSGIDLALAIPFWRLRAGAVFVRRCAASGPHRSAAGASHIRPAFAASAACKSSIRSRRCIGLGVELLPDLIANRGVFQFVLQAVDDEGDWRVPVMPSCQKPSSTMTRPKLLPSAWVPGTGFRAPRTRRRLCGCRLLRLIVAGVVERAENGLRRALLSCRRFLRRLRRSCAPP